jgi:glutamine amidotransferase
MARLVGFISNRPDLGNRAIEHEARHLVVRNKPDIVPGWGVGFYQNGEILLKRRPIDDRPEIKIADMIKDLRADLLLAHVRMGTVGGSRTENTHPFRYRQWLFAHTGTIEHFPKLRSRMSDSLPQFLQRDVRGDTDSEILFHLFLSFLHDAGQLDRPAVDPATASKALRSCVSLVDRLCAEEGIGPSAMNILVSSTEYLIAAHGGGASRMAYRVYRGRNDFERLFGEGEMGRMRLPDFAQSQLSMVASDFEDDATPPEWTPVQGRAIVTFTRVNEPSIETV